MEMEDGLLRQDQFSLLRHAKPVLLPAMQQSHFVSPLKNLGDIDLERPISCVGGRGRRG